MGKALFGVSFVVLIGAVIAAFSFEPQVQRRLQLAEGRVTVALFPSALQTSGVKTSVEATAPSDETSGEQSAGFAIASSNLVFTLAESSFKQIEGGSLRVNGGFALSAKGRTLDATSFRVVATQDVKLPFQLWVGQGKRSIAAFDLTSPRPFFTPAQMGLMVVGMDMRLNADGAKALGRPDLAGTLVGTLSVFGTAKAIDGGGPVVDTGDRGGSQSYSSANIDVMLFNMSSLTSLGRVGTFPNGVNGLSMSTTSCNVGTGNIPWQAPMQVAHPVIAMQLYRVMNGRFEEVGWSWLKHGFFATNSNGCGTCQNPGTGSLLGPNCSDTYGTGNNGDRRYLGERKEVNPFTGVWTCTNSYFSGYQNDCIRRNDGSGLNVVEHRLQVQDADLGNAGATYYYEAYYINANDFDLYNNIGSRQATMSWNGTTWTINGNVDAGILQGPAINRWGEMRSTAQPTAEGDVIVAVQTTSLGNGMWHYEFAVYNHNMDRQVREFIVPVPQGTTIQNVGFHDVDQNAANQWASSVAGGEIKWSTGDTSDPNANPLGYASVFNFRFDADLPPASTIGNMTPFKPGSATTLTFASKGPIVLLGPESFIPINGQVNGGGVLSLVAHDGSELSLSPQDSGSRSGTGIGASLTAPQGAINSLAIGVFSRNSLAGGTGAHQTVSAWNWNTSAWELLDNRPATANSSLAVVTVASNAARFVNASTREVKLQVLHSSDAGAATPRWTMWLDQVGVHYN